MFTRGTTHCSLSLMTMKMITSLSGLFIGLLHEVWMQVCVKCIKEYILTVNLRDFTIRVNGDLYRTLHMRGKKEVTTKYIDTGIGYKAETALIYWYSYLRSE